MASCSASISRCNELLVSFRLAHCPRRSNNSCRSLSALDTISDSNSLSRCISFSFSAIFCFSCSTHNCNKGSEYNQMGWCCLSQPPNSWFLSYKLTSFSSLYLQSYWQNIDKRLKFFDAQIVSTSDSDVLCSHVQQTPRVHAQKA